ncbi:response regulator [Spongiibacter sp. KMU-166]|uniref:Response regulator n=1 Tax=Spongiibacter thalassae TaxID=2721624 RepID=A0ABX1GEQ9_9GAMM|nr:response regulator [Spongiibacter thalassae]
MLSVLLIDDSDADNYFHTYSIEKSELCGTVESCTSSLSALDRLIDATEGRAAMPDIIFLDINIPSVDGWEFLEHYKRCISVEQRKSKIFMLSTSVNPQDRARAETHPLISGYISKPLTTEKFIQNAALL